MNAIEQRRRGGRCVRGHWVCDCDDQRGVLVKEAGREGGNESKRHAPVGIYTPPHVRVRAAYRSLLGEEYE